MKCLHRFILTKREDLGDRILSTLNCTKCPKTKTVNRKKPRYVAQDTPRKANVKRVEKLSKALQNPRTGQRRAIRAVSDKRKEWNLLYREKHEADPQYVTAWGFREFLNGEVEVFRTAGYRGQFERHHPMRRVKWCILLYRYCTPELHVWLEANGTKAREMGLLYDVERGELRNPSPHDPLDCLAEFEELKKQYT